LIAALQITVLEVGETARLLQLARVESILVGVTLSFGGGVSPGAPAENIDALIRTAREWSTRHGRETDSVEKVYKPMKKAIIVGASSGIGRALAKLFANDGYVVGLVARRLPLLLELQQEIGNRAFVKQIDVSNTLDAMPRFSEFIQEMEGVDLIIISAGTGFINHDLDWKMNYPRGKPRGIQQPKEKAYAASRGESDPTRN